MVLIGIVLLSNNFQKSINLSNEGLNGIRVGSVISKKNTLKIKGNTYYVSLKKYPKIYVHVQNGRIKEMTIKAEAKDTSIQTLNSIHIGSTFENVLKQYGNNFKRLKAVEMYGTGIEYQDKKSNVKLFFYFDNKDKNSPVRNIEIMQN
jgi:subtilase family serine protease